MKAMRTFKWLVQVVLLGYLVMWTFGLFIVGPLFLFFLCTGGIRIRGYWRLVGAALRGRLMILPNHPSLLYETFGLGMLLFPWYLIVPWCFIWSVPDKRLLDGWGMPGWIRIALRCIQMDRTSVKAGVGGNGDMKRVLYWRGIIVSHPEKGRTFGEANSHKVPLARGERRMQKIDSGLTLTAHQAGAWTLPCWVHVSDDAPVSITTSFRRMFGRHNKKYRPVVYSFLRPAYRIGGPFDREQANAKLQDEIFSA